MHYAKCKLAICKLHNGILLPDLEKQLDDISLSAGCTGFGFSYIYLKLFSLITLSEPHRSNCL